MSDLPARESMEFDVVVVGAGPAGLATAIRLKQKAAEAGTEISVVVVEKGSEVGAHILSGAVIDPIGLDGLLPEWRSDPDRPLKTEVTADEFMYLGHAGGVKMPNLFMPKLMNNHGNFVGSLGNVARYLGRKAEELGVEIYPGFPASEVLVEDGKVVGVATGDMGISRDGEPNANFTRGMELRAKYTIFGEGARGSLTKQMVERFGLNAGPRPPEIRHRHQGAVAGQAGATSGPASCAIPWAGRCPTMPAAAPGSTISTTISCRSASWFTSTTRTRPCRPSTSSSASRRIRWCATCSRAAKRIGYGARAIMEGGWQSVPRLTFPGGCLVGDSAGFVNVPRIKGSHNAILSGMLCADHVFAALQAGRAHDEVASYEESWRASPIGYDLKRVRNVKPLWSRYGTAHRRGARAGSTCG